MKTKSRIWGLAVVVCMGVFAPWVPVSGWTRGEILQTKMDEIQRHKDALAEMKRQADQAAQAMEGRLAFSKHCLGQVALIEQDHKGVIAAERAKWAKFIAVAPSLEWEPGQPGRIPRLGDCTAQQVRDMWTQRDQELSAMAALIDNGETKFPLTGLNRELTRKELENTIASETQELADFRQTVTDGTFGINYPGLGVVTRKSLDEAIAQIDAEIASTNASLDKGEFAIDIPNLGPVTRNQVQAMIKATEDEQTQQKGLFGREEAGIVRMFGGNFSLKGLRAGWAPIEDFKAEMEKQLVDRSIITIWGGSPTLQGLEDQVKLLENNLRTAQQTLASGEYAVPVGTAGAMGKNQILSALAAKAISSEDGAKGLKHIPIASSLDFAIQGIDIAEVKRRIALFPRIAQFGIDYLKLQILELHQRQGEFAIELSNSLKQSDRKLRWLKTVLASFP